MLNRDAALLLEIETAIGYIESFVAGFEERSFLSDSRTTAAVAMYLIVVGESARALSAEAQNEAPEIPWTQIIGLRNRIAHAIKPSIAPRSGRSRRHISRRCAPPSAVCSPHAAKTRREKVRVTGAMGPR